MKRLNLFLWSSLNTYMNDATPCEDFKEAKHSLLGITTAAFTLHLDIMKYTAGLCFISVDHSADVPLLTAHMEEILEGSPEEIVRLLDPLPLYEEISYDGKDTTRQVLLRGQVYSKCA